MVTQEVGESSRGRKERGEQSALQHHVPREVGRSSLDRPLLGDEEAKLKQTCSSSSVFRSEAGAQHESDVTTACIDSAASCQRPVPKNVPQANAAGSPVSPVSNKSNTNEASSSASGPRNLPMAVKRELAAKDREIARLSAKLREIEGDRAAGRASTARNIDSSSEAAPLGGRDEPDRTGAAECPGEGDEGEGAIAHDQGGAEDPLVLQLESLLAGRERMTKELYELRRENAALHEVLAHAMAALRRQGIDESAQGMGSEAGAAEGSGAEREEGEVGGVGGVSGCVVEEMGFSESEWEESVADSEWEGERRDRK